MSYDPNRALKLLRLGTQQVDAQFRAGQEDAIRHVVEGRGRLLVVQRTGWGKSFVYFIAARLLREMNRGPTLLVSPLLSLMRNQIAAAERMGLAALTINSENLDDWDSIERQIADDAVDILLISPERLANERFKNQILGPIASRVDLLVVDEAHCISDWGHDFRPHYRLIERTVRILPPNLRVLATTATANDRVMADLGEILGPDLTVQRGPLHRPSLKLQTIRMPDQAARYAWLAETLTRLEGSGIIYALTKRDCGRVAAWLRDQGFEVEPYVAEQGSRRVELENALLQNRLKALVATTALGMGFDKPDLAFVIHFQCPGSVVAYYQQVGRAGRGIDAAYGVLLSGHEDSDINNFFIESAFPTRAEVSAVLEVLESDPAGLSTNQIMSMINVSKGRIDKTLALLSLESPSPIVKEGSRWQLTAAELSEDFWSRAQRLTDLRRQERLEMQRYLSLETGHMAFLIAALGGDPSSVTESDLPPLPTDHSREALQAAQHFLRGSKIEIDIRKLWPSGGLPTMDLKGKIGEELRPSPGRALCYWGDVGWAEEVQSGKYEQGHFSDNLVTAAADLIRSWKPEPAPTWVTSIPSLRHPDLVPNFAARLAEELGLPYQPTLQRIADRPEQKTMQNSHQQARNVDGSLTLIPGIMPQGPVLLIDDMVDSRWTLTVAAYLLRLNGAAEVFPFALAQTGPGQ